MALVSLRLSPPLFPNPNPNPKSTPISYSLPKPSHRRSPAVRSSSSGHDPTLDPPHRKQNSAFILPLVASAVFLIGFRARACPVLPSPAPITETLDVTESSEDEEFRSAFERWKSKTYALTVPLRIVALRGSVPPSWIKDFFQAQGKRVKFSSDYRATLDSIYSEMSTALSKGSVDTKNAMSADLVSVGGSWLSFAIRDRLIEPIKNVEEQDWFKGLSEKWKVYLCRNDKGELDPNGDIWGAPYRWGTMVIAYKTNKFRKHKLTPIEDWGDLWRPELTGKISMIDSPREVIGAVLKHMGASYNTKNIDSQISGGREAIMHNLVMLQKQVRLFDSVHYLKSFGAGDVWVAVGWSSDVIPAAKRMSNVAVIVPKSGASLWADIWAIPAASRFTGDQIGGRIRGPSPLIHQWIEFCLQTARGLPFQQQIVPGASPVALEPILVEATRESTKGRPKLETNLNDGVPAPEILSRCEFLEPLSDKALEDYQWLISCMQKPCQGWVGSTLQRITSFTRTHKLSS
ncbi:uncharacterized protein A4U43_C04F10620 [Asparagus officinalis]|uniref:Uncharacterized protein n=1 Tax=Asparagus officinalis TaxID=4686 RepID=A0A5P1F0K0_ASPOF|nr:uncharacterized protein LOC109837041 [Asparagus officinalis]ONK71624.1 uncharacterized protein A4U43_C04F10620 [Asparagus officinalis]